MALIISVRNVGSRGGFSYVGPGVYVATPREKDGVMTYRCVDPLPLGDGGWFRSKKKAEAAAKDLAAKMGATFRPGVRHGSLA